MSIFYISKYLYLGIMYAIL